MPIATGARPHYPVRDSLLAWINKHVPVGSVILELGSGSGTTKNLCRRYRMHSVEQNVRLVGLYPSTYIYAPLVNGWYDPEALSCLPASYDLLIIDGPAHRGRKNIIAHFNLFAPVLTIVDDIERPEERSIAEFLVRKGYNEVAADREHSFKQWAAFAPERKASPWVLS